MSGEANLTPVRQIAAHELVVDQIRRALEIGQFRPGERLPAERDLAETLDVSRTTVRAAIAVLERDGLISVRRGRGGGFLVLEPSYDLAEMRARFKRDRAVMRNAFEFRVIVEGGAARLAAERRRKADLPALARLVDRMSATFEAAREHTTSAHRHEFSVLDSSFHLEIARASGNEQLVEAVAEARQRMFVPVSVIFGRIEADSNDDHAEILAAVTDRDPDEAVRLMTEHISRTRRTFETWMSR